MDPSWPSALRSKSAPGGRVGGAGRLSTGQVVAAGLDVVLRDADARLLTALTSDSTGVAQGVVRSRRSWSASFVPLTTAPGIDADLRVRGRFMRRCPF